MSFETRYQNLNDEQRLAVDTIDGPVMVVAGPGTGKTELLGLRVANILRQSDALPSNILCLTFTESGASNMRARLVGLIGNEAYKVAIHTFHSFALDISQRFREEFYEARQMSPADEIRQIETLGRILAKAPYGDALASKNEQGFVYLKSVRDRISKLKRAGLTPAEFAMILQSNLASYEQIESLLLPVFDSTVSKKTREAIPELLAELKSLPRQGSAISHSSLLDYTELLIVSLELAYTEAVEEANTKALTAWKNSWFKKDTDNKELHLKDKHQLKRNLSLAAVYAEYQQIMNAEACVDFDDMIMDLIQILIKKPGLMAELQEQYQYILVDEFQDTNEAQMRIINLLADNPVNEGRPNLMVVGDDDQAIYKFQGAELNNVLQFQKTYPATQFISLNKNYRSTAPIVDFAQIIIKQGQERLDKHLPELKKFLQAANSQLRPGQIKVLSFDTVTHEYSYLIEEIKAQLAKGTPATEIAVIARNHRQLLGLVPQLQAAGITIAYEKQRNVLEEEHIIQLINLAKLVQALASEGLAYAQELLTEVIGYKFWGLARKTVWQLAIEASEHRKDLSKGRWLDAMLANSDPDLVALAEWLLELAARAKTQSLAQLLDELIGPEQETVEFSSPFRRYYFNRENYQKNPSAYLDFLAALNSFVNRIRSYANTVDSPRLQDLIDCVAAHQKHGVAITDTSPSLGGEQAINLLTAHKAKGLEFDTVFVVNCQENIWTKGQKNELIAFPKNLPIDPTAESMDDYLRLFFVAITRARRQLYLTGYRAENNGKEALGLPFLAPDNFSQFAHQLDLSEQKINQESLITSLAMINAPAPINLQTDEKALLAPLLEHYAMSVTHLNNFLNVTQGGPHSFLEQNLLHFPQAKSVFTSYGTAMHATIEAIYHHLKTREALPSLEEVQNYFAEKLGKEKMSELDYKDYLAKGREVWQSYWMQAKQRIAKEHWIETDFKQQQVVVDGVLITGKIDKIVVDEESKMMRVYDFKTGNPTQNWQGHDEKEKIKLHGYKRQLAFYKLLVENSRDYHQYQVAEGALEFLSLSNRGEMIVLNHTITEPELERLKTLIKAVDHKIRSLDFPDTSHYEQSLAGMIAFEDDLLTGLS
jgi:DNA helicase-2/ATP-dependent DNA helicase PcrA